MAKMQRIYLPNVGGGMAYVPGGSPYQLDDWEKFPLGTYVRLGNKGYVYSLSAGITNLQQGVKTTLRQPVGWSTIAATVAAGVKQVTVDLESDQGPLGDGNILEDVLRWGEICLMPTWGTGFTRTILRNSALGAGTGGEFTVTFDSPTPAILTEDIGHAECIQSPYRGVVNGGDDSTPVVGMATLIAPTGKYLWLQVEGPFGIAAQGDIGNGPHRMQGVFRADGTIGPHEDADGNEAVQQHAGVIMALSLTGGQGTPFCNLQIAH